ncbi:Clavaminate synthase-like protein [Cadophora sp. DSE1049]|nr:Clavaminate synthase-like protein [Cadophora sp. DSE1049]
MAPSADVVSASPQTIPYYSKGLRQKFKIDATRPVVGNTNQKYADIGYNISEEKYLARSKKNAAVAGIPTEVPYGWPKALHGPLVWSGSDFKEDESEYIIRIGTAELAEIYEALKYFNGNGFCSTMATGDNVDTKLVAQELEGHEVNRSSFPLPTFGQTLEQAAEEVYDGKGFVIVRGLDPDAYTAEDLTVIYLGISSYIAERRGKQDQRGSMLMHAMEREGDNNAAKVNTSPPIQNITDESSQPFHTDTVCDCLALITRSCSAEGGKSVLASSWTVYNDLAATRPDLIHVLSQPDWPFDTYGRDPAYYKRAIMYYHEGKVILNVSRRLLVGAPRYPRTEGIPGLTEAQAEALDALHFIAQKYEIRPSMEKGDMRFVNNLGILHRREAFENDGDRSRHLIRLWLNNESLNWKLPSTLRLAWARVFEDDDGERGPFWDIVPPRKDGKVLRVAGSCD